MINLKTLFLFLFFGLTYFKSIYSKDIPIGHLVDFTGPTSSVGKPYGMGFIDAIKYINENGGIKGKKIKVDNIGKFILF